MDKDHRRVNENITGVHRTGTGVLRCTYFVFLHRIYRGHGVLRMLLVMSSRMDRQRIGKGLVENGVLLS